MALGFWQIVLIVLLALLLFGRGRISDLMGDVARGIRNFRKGLNDEDIASASSEEKVDPKKITDQRAANEILQKEQTSDSMRQ